MLQCFDTRLGKQLKESTSSVLLSRDDILSKSEKDMKCSSTPCPLNCHLSNKALTVCCTISTILLFSALHVMLHMIYCLYHNKITQARNYMVASTCTRIYQPMLPFLLVNRNCNSGCLLINEFSQRLFYSGRLMVGHIGLMPWQCTGCDYMHLIQLWKLILHKLVSL